MKNYDEVISLGYNCEISFRIRDYYGKLCSWPFSWTYILDRDAFLDALSDLEQIFQGKVHVCQDNRVNSMIECDKYHICFHPRSEFVAADGTIPDTTLQDAISELRERVLYLTKKFESALKNTEKQFIFFVGLTNNGKTTDYDFLIKLKSKLDLLCPAKNYILVAVVQKNKYTADLEQLKDDNIKIRTIKKFGKQRCNDISTDMLGWGKLFKEFLGKENLNGFYIRLTVHRLKRIFNAILKRIQKPFNGFR
ncbi:MAG: hypothetical protein MR936_12430 [Eubacterium sp.]|nr:hypothetical protein [Eubacterium sp.]